MAKPAACDEVARPAERGGWARRAEARLPRKSIVALEIGNEPDIYSHSFWQDLTAAGRGARILPASMSATSYAHDFRAYAGALSSPAPDMPLFGPALAEPARNLNWVSGLLASPHPRLGAITVHRYPYSACAQPGSRSYPTIARVLSENATAGTARTVRGARRLAARARLPLRLTEINSVTCGGTRGVSDTFATALWAPDALFELLRAGRRLGRRARSSQGDQPGLRADQTGTGRPSAAVRHDPLLPDAGCGPASDPCGTWRGRPAIESVTPGRQSYQLTIPRLSATLLTVHLRPGALAGKTRPAATRYSRPPLDTGDSRWRFKLPSMT